MKISPSIILTSIALALGTITMAATAAEEEKAPTLAEAKAAFAAEDSRLNEVYGKLRKTLDEWYFPKVQQDQREWLEFRDGAAGTEACLQAGAEEGKEEDCPMFWEVRERLTTVRVMMLEAWLEQEEQGDSHNDEDDWSGEWTDGRGGWMHIVKDKDKEANRIFFTIEVVRGPSYHLGSIVGTAKTNGVAARFSDAGAEQAETELPEDGETWLDFRLGSPLMTVSGINTLPYHGARAYFDGKYIRVGKLTDTEAKAVIAGKNPFGE